MTETEQGNIKRVLEAFDTLYNRRDLAAAEAYWSPRFVQHAGLIPPGRDGLFDLVRALPDTFAYDHATTAANGDHVFVFGRYRNFGHELDWVAVDLVRLAEGLIVEQWNVVQDEFTREMSRSGLPMFGAHFPDQTRAEPAPN